MPGEDILTNLKIVVLGSSGVGKSSLLRRFVDDNFQADISATIGVDFMTKVITTNGNMTKLALWDTAGSERYRTLTPAYYRGAQGAIFVYDVTNRESFNDLGTWLRELELYKTKDNIVKMVIGNKLDLENWCVTKDEGLAFARKQHAMFIEASAKTREGVQDAFEELVEKIIQTPKLWESAGKDKGTIKLNGAADDGSENGRCYSC